MVTRVKMSGVQSGTRVVYRVKGGDLGSEAGFALVAPLAQVGGSSASGSSGCNGGLVSGAVPLPLLQIAHLPCCLYSIQQP